MISTVRGGLWVRVSYALNCFALCILYVEVESNRNGVRAHALQCLFSNLLTNSFALFHLTGLWAPSLFKIYFYFNWNWTISLLYIWAIMELFFQFCNKSILKRSKEEVVLKWHNIHSPSRNRMIRFDESYVAMLVLLFAAIIIHQRPFALFYMCVTTVSCIWRWAEWRIYSIQYTPKIAMTKTMSGAGHKASGHLEIRRNLLVATKKM